MEAIVKRETPKNVKDLQILLVQVWSQVLPETNTEHVVSYDSRSLKNAERFYSFEREALAIIWAIGLC